MHVVQSQAVLDDPVQAGSVDRAAVTAEVAEAGVVEHDQEDVRGILPGSNRSRPGRTRFVRRTADHPGTTLRAHTRQWASESSRRAHGVKAIVAEPGPAGIVRFP